MKTILLFFVVLSSLSLRSVVFVDAETKEPLVGVAVKYDDSSIMTDMDGIAFIDSNVDSISVSYVSYKTEMISVSDTVLVSRVDFCPHRKNEGSSYLSLRK